MEKQDVVVFRIDKDYRNVCALFPFIDSDRNGIFCTSYAHVGQHSAADYQHCIETSWPATPEQYKDLKRELEQIGYGLNIKTRKPRKAA